MCDTKQIGKLNREQFALAMWMINQKLKGIDPPHVLTTEMIPPSLRATDGIVVSILKHTEISINFNMFLYLKLLFMLNNFVWSALSFGTCLNLLYCQ